jgi:hypothetical protein
MKPLHFVQYAALVLPACADAFVAEQQKSGHARTTYVSILKQGGEKHETY